MRWLAALIATLISLALLGLVLPLALGFVLRLLTV
jgi:hypothetical protein